jgi:hypothetical protein
MVQQVSTAIQNSFIAGLKTEFTGLNFPENACTATQNCVFSLIGDVSRRLGFDYETNYALNAINRAGVAVSSFKWDNVGGDGLTQICVLQVGNTLYFFQTSNATVASPMSTTLLGSTVNINTFLVSGNPSVTECTYAHGNGYLFVYHPNCDPFYCTYASGVVTANVINIQIRDFQGIPETVAVNLRTPSLTVEHSYNLVNQGWNSPWTLSSTTFNTAGTGSFTFTVKGDMSQIQIGNSVIATANDGNPPGTTWIKGTVTAFTNNGTTTGNTLTFTETSTSVGSSSNWTITADPNYANIFFVDNKVYPSNADVWWQYRDTNLNTAFTATGGPNNLAQYGNFNPTPVRVASVPQNNAQAPQGAIILPAFKQDRTLATSIQGLTAVTTTARPSNGAFFQGRVWYTGVSASQPATGDVPYYTWTENIYFSQVITGVQNFPRCFQQNDPTAEGLFDLLPTDGGVITIQGSGTIYKLFPIQNGLLVFASNGIWFITGSQGIGFSAEDYTITNISGIKAISSTSFIDVNGYPVFWNIEGIYSVTPSKQGGGLQVEPLTIGTILSYYAAIPLSSKKYARGDYNPIDYVVQWAYKSTEETSITDRYQFDTILTYNTANKAFYPYTFPTDTQPYIHDIKYIANPSGSITVEQPTFKYLTSVINYNPNTNVTTYNFTFSEEQDGTTYFDWFSFNGVGYNYVSSFTTGYMLPTQALRMWQPFYVYMYSENTQQNAYIFQGIWDYATSGTSGKYSTRLVVNNNIPNFNRLFRRHRVRGHGTAFQLNISSVSGQPFEFMGWAMFDVMNASI